MMIETTIPGYRALRLEHLVMDYNGTLACGGLLLPGVKECLEVLREKLTIHVLTADTFGKAEAQLEGVPCELTVLGLDRQDVGKLEFVKELGADRTAAVGNGRNDRLMLEASALGIAVILEEGAAGETLAAADVVCKSITSALHLLIDPLRLVATLRS